MTIQTAQLKRLIAAALLDSEPAFMVTVDTQATTTLLIPQYLCKLRFVSLVFGYNLPVKIPDLLCDEAGISGTLSFGRTPFACSLPWGAVVGFAALDGVPIVAFAPGMTMPAEAPAKKRRQALRHDDATPPKRGLRLVRGGASAVPAVNVGRREAPAEGPKTA